MIKDVLIPAFWDYSTQLTELIVPLLALFIVMRLIADLVLGDRR